MSTTNTSFVGRKGDIRVGFGFKRVPGMGMPEPTIILFRSMNQNVCVELAGCHMHYFDERERDPFTKEPKCMPHCARIAEMLYGMPTSYGATRVLDAITEYMTDLKNMPPPSMFRNPEEYLEVLRARGHDIVDFGEEQLIQRSNGQIVHGDSMR